MDKIETTPDWLDEATGTVDLAKLIDGKDGIYSLLRTAQHSLLLLVNDLEHGFDLHRGRVNGTTVTLGFQVDGIDASLWLVGEAWSRIKDTVAIVEKVQQALDGAA